MSGSVRYIPSWLPGGRFRAFADNGRPLVKAMAEYPYEFVMKQRVSVSLPSESEVV